MILHPGLARLLKIEVRATLRSIGRRLRTAGGVFALVGWAGLVTVVMLSHTRPELRDASVLRSVPEGQRLAVVTLFMLAMWVLTIALVDERTGQGLSGADVDQLFGAPLSDAQIVRYQLGRMMVGWLGTGLLGGPLLSYYMHHPIGGPVQALVSAPLFQVPGILVHRLAAGASQRVRLRWLAMLMLLGVGGAVG
ncbi:MAG TPA: putative ABC exporter domain-containing protein, partial [Myxococcota bacterium]|nr:putative ABC exporter domain-containing protein [Myxococcota bacterium]